ncbi:MAG: fumarylacetoacetate hydrolase family protein [Thermomicrobiales bacterium]|nr:fumarylacetoacetate hydrolase family protein [Thermomicrobiales bacterium]
MKLASYRAAGGELRAGLVVDDAVIDVERAGRQLGEDLAADLLAILAQGQAGMAALERVAAAATRLEAMPLAELALGPVLPRPPKILLLAGNYQSHITEGGAPPVNKAEITPRFFLKPGTAVIGTGEAIRTPPISAAIDYEVEVAAVIGRGGRDIAETDALAHVAGYVLFNDISARRLTVVGNRKHRNGDEFFDWLVGKWCDTFAVIGPYLVTADEIPDVGALELALRVNGELRQHSSAGEMIFTLPEAIAWISAFLTLEPGDLICMGTPGGVGDTTQTYLQPGDLVEATAESLGALVNRVA